VEGGLHKHYSGFDKLSLTAFQTYTLPTAAILQTAVFYLYLCPSFFIQPLAILDDR
jgi:hypothetical protein